MQRRFPIVDILFCAGDIQRSKCEVVRNRAKKHVFLAPNFFGGEDPKFRTWFLKLHPVPIMWQSFVAERLQRPCTE